MTKMGTIKGALLGTIASAMLAGPALAEEVIRVTNWGEYIGEETIANFEKETGIKVIYDPYDSVEAADAKLLAGDSGYDVVSHASSQIARLIPAGIIQPLDKSKLPNFKHMIPEVMEQISEKWDPDNNHIVPYMWGTHGVTYNEELVLAADPDAPIGSMEMIFDPAHLEKISQCGVALLDSPTDVIPMALAHLGLPPDSTSKEDYEKAGELLKAIRPFVKTFDNYAYQRMPEKEFCVAVTWGPDGLLAMSTAADADTGVELDFFLPEGPGKANLWVDGWVIPADAKNVEGAHKFLNYMMRPDVAAGDSNFTWYATANQDAIELIDEAVTSSPASFPPADKVANMYTLSPLPKNMERVRTRLWTDVKAGQ
ncbi:MAG: extracellular solute-binding protein [Pseudomonadota bacterium]